MKFTDNHLKVMWLCFACPEVMPNSTCVLKRYRDNIAAGKTDMVEKLKDDEVISLFEAHKKCLKKRTEKKLLENQRCA